MRVSKTLFMASAALVLTLPSAGFAQGTTQGGTMSPAAGTQPSTGQSAVDGAKLAQGSTVYDTNGGIVGTVESLQGDTAVVGTGKNKVALPKSSFAMGDKGPVIGMTAAQLDQAAAQAAPQASATAKPDVVKGASVVDTKGGAVGTIADVDSQFATVTLTTGGKVRLPVTAFGAGDNGALRVAMTAAQLSAAAGVATPAKGG